MREILELIFAIAKKIIHHQIGSEDQAVKESIIKALHFAAEKSKVIVKVNPEDLRHVEKIKPELLTRIKEMRSIEVTTDAVINRGGCILETPCGDVDATIETQLEKIYQSLDRAFSQKDD